MSKKPEDRFPTAAAVLEALESWISGTPVLPLDKPDDEAYQEAVAVLEAEAVSSELLEAEEEVADLPLAEVISDANLVVIDDSSASLLLPPLPPSLPLVEDKMSFPWPLLVSLGGLLIVFAGLLVWYIVLTR